MARRRKKSGSSRVHGGWLIAVAATCFIVGVFWERRQAEAPLPGSSPEPPASAASAKAASSHPVGERRSVRESTLSAPLPRRGVAIVPVGHGHARIALVIDDLGRSTADVERLQGLGIPWTGSVLPFEGRTREVVSALQQAGVEYLCHLPMQGVKANPGLGALRLDMTAAELAAATRAALAAVPGATGVNNHMGSVLSAERAAMTPILRQLALRDLFFLDSRTSPASVGYRLALELGMPAAERQVFLDADASEAGVEEQFGRWLELARRRGGAIAIGHPHPYTLAVLEREVPRALAAGYEFVPASFLLDRPALGVTQ
ncbi:MAG: divergent polysaccharide deacetylase family protein [Acidobacteria bacterium]|nr:divergent polysaccharide deacetylase family protein [Acidobacteriota bacterium]